MGKLIDADKLLEWMKKACEENSQEPYEIGKKHMATMIENLIKNGYFNSDPIPLPTIKPGDKDVDTANLIADLLFAFINKDVYCPHDFEIKAFKNALNVLCKHYGQIKYNPRLFEDYLQSMMEVSHD